MLESLVEWMSYPLYYAFDGAAPPPRTGASHATIYPYGPFPAGDGKIGDARAAERARVGGVLRQGAAATGACDRRALLRPTRSAARRAHELRAHDRRRVFAPLTAAGGRARGSTTRRSPTPRVNDMHDVWEHPQLQAHANAGAKWIAAGRVPALLAARLLRTESLRAWIRCRALGEHTDAILAVRLVATTANRRAARCACRVNGCTDAGPATRSSLKAAAHAISSFPATARSASTRP